MHGVHGSWVRSGVYLYSDSDGGGVVIRNGKVGEKVRILRFSNLEKRDADGTLTAKMVVDTGTIVGKKQPVRQVYYIVEFDPPGFGKEPFTPKFLERVK